MMMADEDTANRSGKDDQTAFPTTPYYRSNKNIIMNLPHYLHNPIEFQRPAEKVAASGAWQ